MRLDRTTRHGTLSRITRVHESQQCQLAHDKGKNRRIAIFGVFGSTFNRGTAVARGSVMSDHDYLLDWLDTTWAEDDRLIVAVDPGTVGAMAWLDSGSSGPERAVVVDLPMMKVQRSGGTKSLLDHAALASLLNLLGDTSLEKHVELVMEAPQSMGGFGEKCPSCHKPRVTGSEYNGLRMGLNAGGFPMAAALYGWKYYEYHPRTWKNWMKLSSDKELSRMTARRIFPGCVDRLDRKKDEGRAEALLLAEFHLHRLSGGTVDGK